MQKKKKKKKTSASCHDIAEILASLKLALFM